MEITGLNFIGNDLSGEGDEIFPAINPANGTKLLPGFHDAVLQEIDKAAFKAHNAFHTYSKKNGKEKAVFLEIIAQEILSLGDILIERCHEETGLPKTRVVSERGRTVNQLKLFAELLRDGSWVEARIDTAIPERQPVPKPDIRSMYKPLGPAGIFGASNFPLAFSVAGGDTASALAAGCTVIFKAHPSHPGTCELTASAIINAVKKSGMPDGTFSMVHGQSNNPGMAIVKHPLIKAIGFTGSFKGGKAIFDAAAKRVEPIPVYAEMGSTNPVFILPGALKERKGEIAKGLTDSVILGTGQFCTNPGLVFYEDSEDSFKFLNAAAENIKNSSAGVMLSSGIQASYRDGIKNILNQKGIELIAEGKSSGINCEGISCLLGTTADVFLSDDLFEEEIFGPSTLAVKTRNKAQLLEAAQSLSGHLTATIHASHEDLIDYKDLIEVLEGKAGRLIINGYPTGVEVCHSMMHGGPFPATTDSRSTSVGTLAINRFVRPVCFQNFSDELLPHELKNGNPLKIWRLVNGERTRDKVS
ncbi:MAG TPA: aldehyde dehydrogenase (NADP(+)) [Ignavibacteriaceae bacterium]|nr:aldehyde dehydrogenase (NADP(+)) [Ignavibacteriaceae bacterium]